MQRIATPFLVLLVAGCTGVHLMKTAPDRFRPMTSADSLAYLPYLQAGNATIAGQAFRTTQGGDVKYAAGRTVMLDPITDYSKEYFAAIVTYGGHWYATPKSSETFSRARRTTTADAEGRFSFAAVPPGEYLVRTEVNWVGSGVTDESEGVIGATVRVAPGETKTLVVSRAP